jgi:hypothetical protein
LVGAKGWLNPRLWLGVAAQAGVAGAFATAYLLLPPDSIWLLLFALLHGLTVAAWLLRHPLKRVINLRFARQPA